MGARLWDEPLVRDDETVDLDGPIGTEDIRQAREQAGHVKRKRIEAHR